MRKKVYMTGGYNTVSMGTGRNEFHPKKPRPDLEHYIKEAGQGTLKQIGGADNVDETVIGNFMAARFNKQAHLTGFAPIIDDGLQWKPAISVEGACGSGGLALMSGIKSVLAETANVVLSLGVEVQNTVKAVLIFWLVPDGIKIVKTDMHISFQDNLVTGQGHTTKKLVMIVLVPA